MEKNKFKYFAEEDRHSSFEKILCKGQNSSLKLVSAYTLKICSRLQRIYF